MSEQDRQIDEILQAALGKDDPKQQEAYIEAASAGNPDMRRQLLDLLHARRAVDAPPDPPPPSEAETWVMPSHGEPPSGQVGPYRLLQKIGEGGFGVVYLAEQKSPIKRRVALKIIKPGMDTRQVIARFDAERQALALMDHPNIARVLDAGETDNGRPFFVMELVKGVRITDYCDEQHLSLRERLELFLPVCQAIQHAHQKGIIHRDLKPSNILVAAYDHAPVPKIIDFGVAKALNQQLTEKTVFTGFDQVVGTLEYMSPEQARLNQLDIDTRSDIYSLAAVLYELITGAPPFEGRRLRAMALDELLRVIREDEPPPPSFRLSSSESLPSLAASRASEPRKLTALVRGDVDWIVMKGLDKDRSRRYDSANDLARDLQRYLNHETVSACPPSVLYRLRKFARRNRVPLVASALLLAAVLLGTVGTLSQYLVARSYYDEVREKKVQLEQQIKEVEKARNIADRHKAYAEKAVWDSYLVVSDSPELLGSAPGTQRLRKELLSTARDHYAWFVKQTRSNGLEYERGIASNRLALVESDLGNIDAALVAYAESAKQWQKLCEQAPDNMDYRQYYSSGLLNWAKTEYTAGHLDAAEKHASQAQGVLLELSGKQPAAPEYKRDLAWSHNVLGNVAQLRDDTAHAIEHYEQAIQISELLLKEDPADAAAASRLAGCSHNVSAVLKRLGRLDEAIAHSTRAVDVVKSMITDADKERPRGDLASFETNLGVILTMKGKREEALALHRSALDNYRRLAEQNPAIPDHREGMAKACNSIGIIMEDFGRNADAASEYRSAIAIREPMVQKYPDVPEYAKELVKNYGNLARVLKEQGDRQGALENINKSIELARNLTVRFADTPEYCGLLASGLTQLGQQYLGSGEYDKAEENFRAALEILSERTAQGDDTALYRAESSDVLQSLASLAAKRGNYVEAEACHRRAIEVLKKGKQEEGSTSGRLKSLAETYMNLAQILTAQGRPAESVEEYENAIAVARQLFDNRSEVPGNRGLLAAALCNLGLTQFNAGENEGALEHLSSAVRCGEQLLEQYPESARIQEYFCISCIDLAMLYIRTERFAEAEELYERVLSFDDENAAIRAVMATAARQAARLYRRVGDLARAGARFERAMELGQEILDSSPTPETAHEMMLACSDLGSHLAWVKQPDRARIAFQRGINTGEQLVRDHPTVPRRLDLACLYAEAGRLEHNAFKSPTALDFYLRAIELHEALRQESSDATVHETALVQLYINLANSGSGATAEESLEALGKAIAIGRTLVDRFPEALNHRESLMMAHLNRAITLGDAGKSAEAGDDYRAAIEVSRAAGGADDDSLAITRVPALVNLGLILDKLNRTDEAIECNREAIETGRRLAQEDAMRIRLRIDTAGGEVNQASLLLRRGEYGPALELLQAARERLAATLSSEQWSGYARTFLTNSLSAERRCYDGLLGRPPQESKLDLVESALDTSIDWSEGQLTQWSTDHPNYSVFAFHLAHVRNRRAWLRATDPREGVRKGVQAVADAARACELSSYQAWRFIETLAAAYAEVGSFEEAVQRQQQAIELAPEDQRAEMRERLELYSKGEAFRQSLVSGEPDGNGEPPAAQADSTSTAQP